jgi:hypothetical protein
MAGTTDEFESLQNSFELDEVQSVPRTPIRKISRIPFKKLSFSERNPFSSSVSSCASKNADSVIEKSECDNTYGAILEPINSPKSLKPLSSLSQRVTMSTEIETEPFEMDMRRSGDVASIGYFA